MQLMIHESRLKVGHGSENRRVVLEVETHEKQKDLFTSSST